MNAIMKAPEEGALAAAVRRIYEWMTREKVQVVNSRRPEAEDVQRLTPKGIADATAALMWAQRGSLTISIPLDGYEERGLHTGKARRHEIAIPGGIRVDIPEEAYSITITAPDGAMENVDRDQSSLLTATWRTIQAVNALEALGLPVPEANGGIRPGRAADAVAMAIADMLERADLPKADATFQARMSRCEEEYSDEWGEVPTEWLEVGSGVYLSFDEPDGHRSYGRKKTEDRTVRVMTASHGVLPVRYQPLHEALERRKRSSFAAALGIAHELPVHLPAPRGNAQATRILQLCREAVAAEPELADAAGTPIAPLVNRHLPELMRIHAEAAASAPADQLAAIDAELMTGIERVRLAVDEALLVSANHKRDALRTQLAFLEMRHPDAAV